VRKQALTAGVAAREWRPIEYAGKLFRCLPAGVLVAQVDHTQGSTSICCRRFSSSQRISLTQHCLANLDKLRSLAPGVGIYQLSGVVADRPALA